MLIKHRGFEPQVDSSVFVASNATLVGKINIGPKSRVMYGAVIDSEGSEIEIGECSIICEWIMSEQPEQRDYRTEWWYFDTLFATASYP